MTDATQQIEIGKMLSARYIVLGEIIDMMSSFLLSVRMIDVETGKIVWQEEKTESLENYDYIGTYFAGSIAKSVAFYEKKTFVVLKNLNELNIDNEAYFIRVLPAVEHFLGDSFSRTPI